MKIYLFIICLIGSTYITTSQDLNPVAFNDLLSKDIYNQMAKDYELIHDNAKRQSAIVQRLRELHEAYTNELSHIAPNLFVKKVYFQQFCTGTSMKYLEFVYPDIDNLIFSIVDRRHTKVKEKSKIVLDYESRMIGYYLDPSNPLSQGKRIFLILNSLEKTINSVLYNENI